MAPGTAEAIGNPDTRERLEAALPLDAAIAEAGFWWHSIDLNGTVTPGGKNATLLRREWETMDVPQLAGKTVLDIGAWDGYFSFMAEKHGASEIVALDHYVWSVDRKNWSAYYQACRREGIAPKPVEQTEHWNPVSLPGKRGFDVACRALDSRVRAVVSDYMLVTPEGIGTFDVVFYLDVLYHMPNPVDALAKVASLTRQLAIIETHAVEVYGHDAPLAEFYPASELNGDPSNWWGLNLSALVGMCKAAGFSRVEVKKGPPRYGRLRLFARNLAALLGLSWGRRHRHYRAVVHAWK